MKTQMYYLFECYSCDKHHEQNNREAPILTWQLQEQMSCCLPAWRLKWSKMKLDATSDLLG